MKGVNDMGDGVNLSRPQVTRPLVLPTEIVDLPNLAGYLRLGRDLPVIRFVDRFHPGKVREPAYVDRTKSAIRLDPSPYPAIDDSPAEVSKGFVASPKAIFRAVRSATPEARPENHHPPHIRG